MNLLSRMRDICAYNLFCDIAYGLGPEVSPAFSNPLT